MKRIQRTSCSLLAILLLPLFCAAKGSKSAGEGAAVFLRDGQGGRALGMSGAYTAVGRGISAIYWNPGGMAFGRTMSALLNYNTMIDGISAQSAAFLMPVQKNRGAIAVNGLMMSMGSIDRRDASGTSSLGSASLSGSAYALSYGARSKRVGVGLTVKSVQEDLYAVTGKATALDGGLLWRGKAYSFGAAFQNVGTKYKAGGVSKPLTSAYRAGGAWHPENIGIPYLDRLTVGLDALKESDQDIKGLLGTEYILNRLMSFRVGYEYAKDRTVGTGIAFGLGVWTDFTAPDFNLGNEESDYKRGTDSRVTMELDYAYLMKDVYNDLHRITLTFHF